MKNLGIKITIVLIALVTIMQAQAISTEQDSIIQKNISSLLYLAPLETLIQKQEVSNSKNIKA